MAHAGGLARTFWLKFDRDWGWNLARLIAYTCVMALFATLGLDLIILALVLRVSGATTERALVADVVRLLPDRVASSAVASFAHSLQATPAPLLVLALPLTLWYGTRFFVVLESCFCVIFRRNPRTFVRQNVVALGMLAFFAVAAPVILLSATHEPILTLGTEGARTGRESVAETVALTSLGTQHAVGPVGILAVLAGLLANFALMLLGLTLLTPGRVRLRAAWPGALLGAVLAQGYLLIFPLYARYILQPTHFGTVAGFVLVVLVFFFAYGMCVVIGAEVSAVRAGYTPAAQGATQRLAGPEPVPDVTATDPAPLPAAPPLAPPVASPARPGLARTFGVPLPGALHARLDE